MASWAKLLTSWMACFLIRLAPFRPPNVEPIMSAIIPISQKYGQMKVFFFGFASIYLFDVFEGRAGIWTLVTATAYGLVGIWSSFYFRHRKGRTIDYVKFTVWGTLSYDIVTGLGMGPLLFHQPFAQALLGQIPFTILHLLGNIAFAVSLSPLFYRWLNTEKKKVLIPVLTRQVEG